MPRKFGAFSSHTEDWAPNLLPLATPLWAEGGLGGRIVGRRGRGSVGRASPCQGEGRGFESRRPLQAVPQVGGYSPSGPSESSLAVRAASPQKIRSPIPSALLEGHLQTLSHALPGLRKQVAVAVRRHPDRWEVHPPALQRGHSPARIPE